MAQAKKQSFFGGAAVLAAGVVVVKIIGAIYKIPLYNILGPEGNASFTNAYNIYAALLTVSTTGLPVALSKMVSEANALARENQARRIFRVSAATFLTLGVLSFCIMWFGNSWCAQRLNWPPAAYGIRTLAPAVVCVGALSAFRGYAQGTSRMTPTAVSQIIEAVCKLVVGLTLAQYLINAGQELPVAAAGAIAGVTVGTVLAVAYMAVDYFRHRAPASTNDIPDGGGKILKRLVSIAVPITLSTSMVSIITLIDTSLLQGQLQNALGLSEKETGTLYGTYASGMNIYNLPSSMMTALTISVLPAVSAALARRDRTQTARVVGSSLRVTGLIAFPMGLGIWALAEPIFKLLYPRYDSVLGGQLLAVLGLASLFVCLMLIANSILQAHGRVHAPIVTMLIGGVVKIVLNYNLSAVPSINIHAAPIGTLCCFAVVAVLNLLLVYRTVEDKPNYLALFSKPLLASLAMAFCAKGCYALLAAHVTLSSGTLTRVVNVGVSVVLAIAVYTALVIALRIITRDDLALLPKGEKLARLLRIK
ncbi:MAG: oligosaccharide flippase family protein [Oscillospiraceae bacterium]|nr:oligosaccharide flippase family protein [Oscillospiraceae bacterium]